jgi:glycosyltransferase involved in cell wall biosynthesis
MEKIKILQFGKFYPPAIGGMERVIFSLTEGLNQAGHHCDVLCSNTKREQIIESNNGYSITRAKTFGVLFSMSLAPGLIPLLWKVRKDYDIIHFHHPDPISALAFFLVRPQAELVIHWHLDIVKQKIAYLFYRPLEKWLLKRAKRIIATSPNYLLHSKPLKAHFAKCTVIPLGVAPLPAADSKRVGKLRSQYAGKIIVFSLGRFTDYKGFQYLIGAAEFLSDKFQIIIGGDGPLRQSFEKQILNLKLADRVKLAGRLDDEDVLAHFSACDIFCLPSITKNEAFGLVLLEAMNFSKPIVATTIEGSGTGWVNEHQVTGLNVAPMDSNALAQAIKKLTEDPCSKEMGVNALRRFETLFTVDKMINTTIQLYRQICKKR